jgi:hypothetical protein
MFKSLLSPHVNHVCVEVLNRIELCSLPPTINIGTLLDVPEYVLFIMVRELDAIYDVSGHTITSHILWFCHWFVYFFLYVYYFLMEFI